MIDAINNIIPVEYIALLIITLIGVFLAARCNFAQKLWFSKKAINDEKIFSWLVPFQDCLVNIEAGEHNHIFIMNAFFRPQKDNIIRIRAEIKGNKLSKINTTWNKYEEWYDTTAKGQIHSLLGTPEKQGVEKLKKHTTSIINEIKKLKA